MIEGAGVADESGRCWPWSLGKVLVESENPSLKSSALDSTFPSDWRAADRRGEVWGSASCVPGRLVGYAP
jgi:hypothetical protein